MAAPVANPGAAPVGPRPVNHGHRSWSQRLLIVLNLVIMVGFLAGAGGLGYLYWRFDRIPRIDIPDGTLAEAQEEGEPQNFLLVGSDTREFVEPGSADDEGFGDVRESSGSGRSDTIIIVRVDPRTDQAAMVSFPRDLWVDIPGKTKSGGQGRINTAFLGSAALALEGPEKTGAEVLIETIKLNFDIPIHHFAQVDFEGFRGLVDAIGGVEVYIPAPVRDFDTAERRNQTGLDIQETGCVNLKGDMALAYVRSRHFQTLQPNGRWKSEGTGDLGRILRQQDFIRRAINKAIGQRLYTPSQLNRLAGVAERNITLSTSIKIDDLVALAKGFETLGSDTLSQFQIPVENSSHFGASTLDLDESRAAEREAMFNVFRGIVPPDLSRPLGPSAVSMRVLNGSGAAGQAQTVADALRGHGFATVETDNASRTAKTVIRYGPDQLPKAELLQRYLVGSAVLESQPGLEGVDVLLVTGSDFAGVLIEPRPVTATTTTTSTTTATTVPAAGEAAEPPVPEC